MRDAIRILIVCGAALAAAALVLPPAAHADPNVETKTSTYDIEATTAAEAARQMSRLGPSDMIDGKRFWALTRWNVRWRYDFRQTSGGCSLDRVRVDLDLRYTFPRWANDYAASAADRRAWENMVAALERHEGQHARHGRDAAGEVEEALKEMPQRSSCDALQEDANERARGIIRKHAARDREYDRETRHGQSEGIRLP